MEELRATLAAEGKVTFVVRVRPNASRTRLTGVMDDDTYKIDLAAAPENGKANAELIGFLAESFAVPRASVSILSGYTDRRKLVRIRLS